MRGGLLVLLLSCFWCTLSVPAYATELSSTDSPTSTEDTLTSLLSNLKQLKALLRTRSIDLAEARTQLEMLSIELDEARRSLETSLTRLAESRRETERSIELLRQSHETLTELRESFEAYRNEATRTIRRWQIAAGAAVIVAILAVIF